MPGGGMRFSGYIFDVEGTLVDSVRHNLLSLQESLADFGIEASYEQLQLYSGLDGNQTLQLVAPDLLEADRKRVLEAQGKLYERKYLASIKAFAGVREVFLALTGEGGRIALATDCKGATLRHYLSLLAVDDLIDSVACGDDVEHGKPDPRLVGLALRKLQVPAAQAVVIGDTPYDAGYQNVVIKLIMTAELLATLSYLAAGVDRNTIAPALLALETSTAN